MSIAEHCYDNGGEGQVSDREAVAQWSQEAGHRALCIQKVCDYNLRDKGCGIAAPCVSML